MEDMEAMLDNVAFTLYAMECEGDLDTRQGKINRFIKELREARYPIFEARQAAIAAECGLDFYDLSEQELAYIGGSL